jgi:hypothetical protein
VTIIVKGRCRLIKPNWRIIRSQFDIDPEGLEPFGEYAQFNLLRERGIFQDGRTYRITIEPLFPHLKG